MLSTRVSVLLRLCCFSVMKGISLAKRGSFENAMKCYKHALEIEPMFAEAYVARGAA